MKFEYVKLSEVAEVTKLAGFEFTKYIKYEEKGDICALRGLNIKKGYLDLSDVKYIDKETSNRLLRSKLFENDIVMTYTGSKYGNVAFIEENDKYHLAPNVAKISIKKEYDSYFYFMVLQGYEFQYNLKRFGVGSGQPTIPMKTIRTIPIPLPTLNIQKKIASFFKNINKKVEINNQIISTLEELAFTLFKRWFVDFEFSDENGNPYKSSGGKMVDSELGEIPEGWEATSLSDIANYKNGLAMQKFRPDEDEKSLPVLKIKELNQGFTDSNSDRCSVDISDKVKIENGDVVFSWSGTLLVKIWTGGDAGLNQHLFKVTSNKFPKWYYYLWTKFYMNKFIGIAKDKATTMGHIKRQHLNEAKVLIPSINMLEKFSKVLGPTIDMVTEKGIENLELSNLRDSLLPKLLSGEIELPEDEEV